MRRHREPGDQFVKCVYFHFYFFDFLYDNYIYFIYVCIEQLYVHVHLLPNSDCKFDFI